MGANGAEQEGSCSSPSLIAMDNACVLLGWRRRRVMGEEGTDLGCKLIPGAGSVSCGKWRKGVESPAEFDA
jgi:hypothetical protein